MANRVLAPERRWGEPSASAAGVRRLRELCEREALPIVAIGVWVTMLVVQMRLLLGPDSWLALVGGRYVAQHGLPQVDTLGYWTLGKTWVDQQWGAQLALYETAAHGGVRAALLVGIGCIGLTLGVVGVVARRLGGSARSTAVAVAVPLLGAPWMAQVRAQSLALPLFVAVYALLAADSRRPGRRVLLTLPLLAVWANVHGSVALGAGLVALYGLLLARHRSARAKGAVLALAAPLTLLVSPDGLRLAGYYRLMLLHPPFAKYVSEWQPASVRAATALFFATVLLGAALWGGHRRLLTSFERWATVVLLVAALAAIRNAVWFELALAIALPRLLDAVWRNRGEPTASVRKINLALVVVTTAAFAITVGVQAARPDVSLQRGNTPAAAEAVAAAAGKDGVVLADEFDADWLLWQQPDLAGRIAYDVRFELLDARQARQVEFLDRLSHPVWARCGSRARVVTFGGEKYLRAARREGVLARGASVIVRSPTFVAVRQPRTGGFCKL